MCDRARIEHVHMCDSSDRARVFSQGGARKTRGLAAVLDSVLDWQFSQVSNSGREGSGYAIVHH